MRVQFAGIELTNPVIAASGTFGYGVEFEEIVSFDRIGGFVTKGLSREPMAGNEAPRLIETASGMMNSIGLQNIGVKAFIEKKLPELRKYPGCAVIANVFGYQVTDYIEVIQQLNDAEGIAAYELNASCPNTDHGGMVFGTDPTMLDELIWRTKQIAKRPLIVKLSPNVTSIANMAKCAEKAGADAVSLVNTFVSLAIDVETRRPRIANVTAGLSGPAIRPIAVRMVWEAARAVKIPVLGMGGIVSAEDAVEFLLA
ncbi:MAG: dihydroorotate dehydrogenase, partial [Silvibacterium sp.]|nr:dihydroorotate dehydrogenase [Silvibacterium sp.]